MKLLSDFARARCSWLTLVSFAGLLAIASAAPRPPLARAQLASSPSSHEAMARELEQRLIAPCCWNQTLEIHESELASELRSEIRARLRAGVDPRQIEDDFASRYGERVRAVPRDGDSRLAIVVIVVLAMAASGVALLLAARRWIRHNADASDREGAADASADAYDQLLDQELRERIS